MGDFPRKADGRRLFSVQFKRETVGRITSGERTLAELSRELEIAPAVLRNWMRLVDRGGTTAVAAGEEVVPASRVRKLEQQVKQLQRLVGKQAMTIEILEAARDLVKKKSTLVQRIRSVTGRPMAAVCRTLRVAGSTAYLSSRPRAGRFYRRAEDTEVLYQILAVTRERASYGVRRTWALVNRDRGGRPGGSVSPPPEPVRIFLEARGRDID